MLGRVVKLTIGIDNGWICGDVDDIHFSTGIAHGRDSGSLTERDLENGVGLVQTSS